MSFTAALINPSDVFWPLAKTPSPQKAVNPRAAQPSGAWRGWHEVALPLAAFPASAALCGLVCGQQQSRRKQRQQRTGLRFSHTDTQESLDIAALEDQLLESTWLARPTDDVRQALQLRGFDTRHCLDRSSLFAFAVSLGILPATAAEAEGASLENFGRRRRRREGQRAPVTVALKKVSSHQSILPHGVFTDGERLALPLWSKQHPDDGPMWFVLDTAIRRSVVSESLAKKLGILSTGLAQGLCFAEEPLGDMQVQIVPDDFIVLGPASARCAGMLGPDFLHRWDLDFDVARGLCSAWPAGLEVPRGFGPRESVEIKLQGSQGLLEVTALLRGTVCSGNDKPGPPIRAVVDLGQTYSACNWAAARQVGILGDWAPCVHRAGEWLDLNGRTMPVCEADLGVELPGRVSGVLQGTRLCDQRLFWIAETLPLLERLGFNPAEPMAVLGLDAVGRARFAVSARHRRMWLPL